MAEEENSMADNKSTLKSFLASIASMAGSDLSNITAPPSVLATKSVVEIPAFWAENPSIFVSPAKSEDPAQRALLMLRSFLAGCRSQCYLGRDTKSGVKKPLNAFLGELFLGRWEDENGTTHLVSEQISHHPPITACRVWNDKYGVVAEGYNRQTITFNGSVNVQCAGHILRSITKYDEHYLLPIPDFKVKGVLSTPYPELSDTHYIPCSSGYTSVIHFSGRGMFSSAQKHKFTAHLYKEKDGESKPIYTIEGHWDTEFTITDNTTGKDIEVFNVEADALKDTPELIIDPIDKQDPWESRSAWRDTVAAIKKNDMQGVNDAKGHIEQGQRDMREAEEQRGEVWKPLFFKSSEDDKVVRKLSTQVPNGDYQQSKEDTAGVWEFKMDAWKSAKKPYHGALRPDNTSVDGSQKSDAGMKQRQEQQQTQPQPQQQPQQQPQDQSHYSHVGHMAGAFHHQQSGEVDRRSMNTSKPSDTRNITASTKQQPAPQTVQKHKSNEQLSRGIQDMSLEEKNAIENSLRDEYSNAFQNRRASRAKRRSAAAESAKSHHSDTHDTHLPVDDTQ